MKTMISIPVILIAFAAAIFSCNHAEKNEPAAVYTPDSKPLYDSIVHLDSVLFAAYNKCDLEKFASMFDDDIEFYHDKGGVMTSKDSIMAATKKYICGKVTRQLVKGSIEVYPIAGYGAIETGQHFFINNQEPKPDKPDIGKFVHTWKKENGEWKLTRVISLH
jgi:ketosteroid isomerase-like protein